MLSDTMKQVNETEKAAQEKVLEAKTQAAAIMEAAKAQAKQILADAETAAKAEAKAAYAQAEKEGEMNKERFASEVQAQLTEESKRALENADAAVKTIVNGLL